MTTETISKNVKTLSKTEGVLNDILLRRRSKVFITKGESSNPNHVKAIGINIASLGYVMSPNLAKTLQTLSVEELTNYNNFLVKSLESMIGSSVRYRPLFRSFPKDVPDVFEYFMERVFGHVYSTLGLVDNVKLLSCGHLIDTVQWDMSNFGACPICQCQIDEAELLPAKERESLKSRIKLKTIDLGSENEVIEIFKNLVSSRTSVSPQDKDDIKSIFEIYGHNLENNLPEEITHKEILAFICPLVLEYFKDFKILSGKIRTSVDVLRIATAMSDGDISLATNSMFKKFKKRERKFLLTILEGCKNIKEDMSRYSNKWIKLGEILHPGEFKKRFPKSFEAFTAIRNGDKIETFNSKTEEFVLGKKFSSLVDHLQSRPSELARRLDFIIAGSTATGRKEALRAFELASKSIPTTTLLQVLANFRIRSSKEKDLRIIMPKGDISKVKVLEETRKPLTKAISSSVIKTVEKELSSRFEKLPDMGNVFIDPLLSEYVVPFSQRSSSKSLITITRGSKVTLSSDNTIRMFLYWKEKGSRADIDLSAVMYDEDWNYKEHISFTNYSGYNCTHSGDIQSAPDGASEFIDIDRKSVINFGARYVVMTVLSYTGQKFTSFEDCFAGTMGRKRPSSGDIFEPKTVKQKFDISSDSVVCIPLILDLEEGKLIWSDISLRGSGRGNSIESNSKNISLIGKSLCKMSDFKPNIYELLILHAKSRGKIVEDIKDADEIFTPDNISSQLDRVMSEFLS